MSKARRFSSKVFTVLMVIYGLSIVLILALRLTVNNDLPPLGIAIGLLHVLVIPSLVLLPLSLLLRRWRLALLLVPALLTLLLSYGQLFIGGAASVADDVPRLRVLTFNIHNEVEDLDWLVDIIRASDADVIAMQELSLQASERLANDLSGEYPHQALHAGLDIPRFAGNGVISRFPILEDEYWRNVDLTIYTLGHQRVALDVNGTMVTLFNSH
ncbi:MAG: hypothetical protein H7175_12485, partial [Burkholderiales bacterium]|nr:hypothetical protein [Anaerolineae bacterium]